VSQGREAAEGDAKIGAISFWIYNETTAPDTNPTICPHV
jgi:hypothetical protein